LIAACADDRILAESDYNDINMSTSQTWDITKTIAEVKQLTLETTWSGKLEEERGVVRRLKENWERFCEGNHTPPSRQYKVNRIIP